MRFALTLQVRLTECEKCDVSRWSIANLSYLLEHTPSQSLYLCLLCSSLLSASSAREPCVHEAEVELEGTSTSVGRRVHQSSMCFCQLRWETRSLDTHGGLN